jgi:type IV pilus assembly protein PilV
VSRRNKHAYRAGFSLVEVMVALVVISVGLLGIAKMQALAISSTSNARSRSLAALEAASLASTMRADRSYWTSITADPNVAVATAPTGFTASDTALVAPGGGCSSTASACTAPAQLAAQDVKDWATALSTAIPGGTATINCTVATATVPTSCTITLTWTENLVQMNTATATGATQAATSFALNNVATTRYTLLVDP